MDEVSEAMAIEKYEKAGKIASEVREHARMIAKPGMRVLDLVEDLEKLIEEKGAKAAFPVNVSINEVAAHYTPEKDDALLIGEKDIVKIDVGVHVDGFIGDTAFTTDFSGEYGKLVEASENALEAAIASVKAGVNTSAIGEAVENEIKKLGFKPIENLCGHSLGEYDLHAGEEIPNIKTSAHNYELKEGDVFAIEPFATNGVGKVGDGSAVEIFSLVDPRPSRMRESRRVINYVIANYKTLPFAERWLLKKEFKSKLLLHAALRELMEMGALRPYPILSESEKGLVSQTEHTVVVEKDGCRVLTK
ncbi:MAG: type II methionyl aminopeptidase [Candidatus Micrarchaeota archaeon]